MNSHNLNGDLMGNFCDGANFAQSELFLQDPCALQIQLYYDEVEVTNPIGSKVNIYKLGMDYFVYQGPVNASHNALAHDCHSNNSHLISIQRGLLKFFHMYKSSPYNADTELNYYCWFGILYPWKSAFHPQKHTPA